MQLWEESPVRWIPPILDGFDTSDPGLHFVIGPRQVGKTTMVKLLIRDELGRWGPFSIFYFSCDEILDHRELGEMIDGYLSMRREKSSILEELPIFAVSWKISFRALRK